jgi:hypothetical protein
MDDETKSAVAKLVDKFTNVVGNVAAAASSAAQHAMESNARRMEPDAGWIAASAGEQVYIPETNDAAAFPAPLIPVTAKKKPTPDRSGGAATAAPKKAKKASKKAAGRNLAGKSSKRAKKTKPASGRKAVVAKKSAKKNARKAAKKSKAKRA